MQGPVVAFSLLVASLLVAAGLLATPARADAPRPRLFEGDVALEYHRGPGASGCPDEAALRERAADAFDFRDPFVPAGRSASSRMRVEITRTPAGYQGAVHVVDDRGAPLASSSEQHVDCDALGWVIGHRIALAISRRAPPVPASASAPPSASAAAPDAPSSRAPAPAVCDERCIDAIARRVAERLSRARAASPVAPSVSDFTLHLASGGLFTFGLTADPGPGIWLGFAAQRGLFSLGLEARGTFPAVALTYEPDRSSHGTTLSGVLVPCARWRILSGCAFVEVGSFLFTIPGRASAEMNVLVSLGPRAAVDLPLVAGFSARLFGELALHPYLPVFMVRTTTAPDSPVVRWVTPVASGLFGAGLVWSR